MEILIMLPQITILVFDKPNIFELWLTKNLDNYPANEEIFPLPEKYS